MRASRNQCIVIDSLSFRLASAALAHASTHERQKIRRSNAFQSIPIQPASLVAFARRVRSSRSLVAFARRVANVP
jgi:hypothetical protein